jgi:hypothetical protein
MSVTAENGHAEVKRGRGRPPKYPEHSLEALLASDEEAGAGEAARTEDNNLISSDYSPPPLQVTEPERQKAAGGQLAYRPDGLPMGELDLKAYGANGLLWGQRDPCDLLSLDQATGWFEWDEARWAMWREVAQAGLADAMLERAHILYRKRRGGRERKTLSEQQWGVVSLLALLVHGYAREGRQTQYADQQYDSAILSQQRGTIRPRRIAQMLSKYGAEYEKHFPFRSGTGVKTQFNPYREILSPVEQYFPD